MRKNYSLIVGWFPVASLCRQVFTGYMLLQFLRFMWSTEQEVDCDIMRLKRLKLVTDCSCGKMAQKRLGFHWSK